MSIKFWLTLSVLFQCSFFRYKAVYNYKPQNSDELELREGDIVQVMEKCDDGWFVGKEFTSKSQRKYISVFVNSFLKGEL